ncbi:MULTISPECIES: nucleotidyltransferase family protein [Cupriavidus]
MSGPAPAAALPTGILLAAGYGRRFDASGRQNKLLARLPDGHTVAARSARTLAAALPGALAVIRPGHPALAAELRAAGCGVLETPAAEAGMGAALAAAIAATPASRGWVVALADMPWLSVELIRAVARAIATPEAIAAPWRDGRRGHPVGFGAAWRETLLALDGDEGARALLKTRPVIRVPTGDEGAFRDVDVAGDLAG